jgi:hypothetical protein
MPVDELKIQAIIGICQYFYTESCPIPHHSMPAEFRISASCGSIPTVRGGTDMMRISFERHGTLCASCSALCLEQDAACAGDK